MTARVPEPPAQSPTGLAVECGVMLEQIEVMADIGILAAEQGTFQPLVIHVSLAIDPPGEDALERTYDYRAIHRAAHQLAAQRIALIEIFARRLAELCLADPLVRGAEVVVDKPRAVPGALARTRVRLTR